MLFINILEVCKVVQPQEKGTILGAYKRMHCPILTVLYNSCCTFLGFENNFLIERRSTSQGLPYDFSSIMHFRHNAFSCDSDKKSTLVPHNLTISRILLGISEKGTDLDFLHLNLLYCGGIEFRSYLCLCTFGAVTVSANHAWCGNRKPNH